MLLLLRRLDSMRTGMGEAGEKCLKLEREFPWIPSEKQHFGRAGGEYDWEACDPEEASLPACGARCLLSPMGRHPHGPACSPTRARRCGRIQAARRSPQPGSPAALPPPYHRGDCRTERRGWGGRLHGTPPCPSSVRAVQA
jgi:hypothetical protein